MLEAVPFEQPPISAELAASPAVAVVIMTNRLRVMSWLMGSSISSGCKLIIAYGEGNVGLYRFPCWRIERQAASHLAAARGWARCNHLWAPADSSPYYYSSDQLKCAMFDLSDFLPETGGV